jgi:DNA-binding transcriptional LysR family regulator
MQSGCAIMHSANWDDLRFVLAVVDGGSAKAAAAALDVDHTTVLRRVSALEKHYGVKLFDRDQSGYRPTPTCHAIVEIARSVSHSVADIEQEILGRHRRLEGRVKLTTTDTIYLCGLEDMIAEFGTLHPDIVIETHVTNAKLDIARYAADIAVRPSRAPPQWLTGRRATGLSFALYGATAEFADTDDPLAEQCALVVLGEALAGSPAHGWINENVLSDRIVLRADSFALVPTMLLSGRRLGIMPCCMGDARDGLMRIGPVRREMDTFIWVLTAQGHQSPQRVRTLCDFLARALRRRKATMEGRP